MNCYQARVFLALFVVLCLGATGFARREAATAVLAWKLEKGDQLELEFEQSQNVLTRIDARDRTLESALTLGVSWEVLDVADNGDATIEQTINRIRLRTGTPGAEVKKVVDLDTGSDERLRGVSRDVMKQIKTLVGLKFTVVMSPNGKVVSVAAGENVAAVVAELPETSSLRRVFDVKAMSRLVSDSAMMMQYKPEKKDDKWTEKSELAMTANDGRAFTFERVINSKVTSVDDKQANVDVEIELSQKPTAPTSPKSALTSPLELTAFTGGGSIVFDHANGNIVSSTITTETKTRVIYREDQVKTTIGTTNRLTVSRK